MKKMLFLSLVLFVGLVPHALAGFVALAPIPGLTEGAAATQGGLPTFFNNLYKYCIGLAAALAVIEIIWGGLEISTQDSVSKKSDGKERITQAIFGLILVLSPVLVFSIINPRILNLSIGFGDPIGNVVGVAVQQQNGNGGVVQTPTADTTAIAAGCSITGTLLKTAICPTQQAAQNFSTACATGPGSVPFFTTQHKATCGTDKGSITGPYSFADTSSGVFATIFGYSNYEPIASTPSNSNNGNAVMQFASTCTADAGTTCLSAIKLPCSSSVVQIISTQSLPTTSCWNISLSCTDGSTGAGGCSSSPQFTVVQTQ